MKRIIRIFMVAFLVFLSITFAQAADFSFYLKASYMDWIEHSPYSGKDPFVKESGLLYSMGTRGSFHLTKNLFSRLELEGFWGDVNYDGSYVSNQVPHKTTGDWLGFRLEETVSYKFTNKNGLSLSPFMSLGISSWSRWVAAEIWYEGYGRLGFEIDKGRFFGKIGFLLPFFTEVDGSWKEISWLNEGRETKIEANPIGVPTPFAEIGVKLGRMKIVGFYERKEWKKSNNVKIGDCLFVFQPATEQNIIGIRAEFNF
jgi:hypothetical protein